MQGGSRIPKGVERGNEFQITVDGRIVSAHEGETIAAALLAAGIMSFRQAPDGAQRGLFCGMGVCFECRMTVNGIPNVQTCVTEAEPGMSIETQREDLWLGGER
jgi:predicted molibdopterin-dependent oxidoreductase YjgC